MTTFHPPYQDASYTVADHLLGRLTELDVGHVFGVSDPLTHPLSAQLSRQPGMSWVDCERDAEATYAAEGYARIRGAAVTVVPVGALARDVGCGARVPVVHVIVAPAGAPDPDATGGARFAAIAAGTPCAKARLRPADATADIDRVLQEVRDRQVPGYLLLPADLVDLPATKSVARLPAQLEAA